MYTLTEQQVNHILNDIRRRGIELEDLQLNLLDHVCCVIESEMQAHENFEEFYQLVLPRFFKKELVEIQEETELLLTFKNYYAMKRTMNITGMFAALSIAIGSTFKILHWPLANMLMFSGVVLITLIFLPLMFTLKLKESTEKRSKLILGLGTLLSALVIVAIIFKMLHWPGATILGRVSIFGVLLIFVPVYLISGFRNPITKFNTLVNSIFIITGAGLLLAMGNQTISKKVIDGLYAIDAQTCSNFNQLHHDNEILEVKLTSDSTSVELTTLFNQFKETNNYILSMKMEMLDVTDQTIDKEIALVNVSDLESLDNWDLPTQVMNGEANAKISFDVLKKQVDLLGIKTKAFSKNTISINSNLKKEDVNQQVLAIVFSRLTQLQLELELSKTQLLHLN